MKTYNAGHQYYYQSTLGWGEGGLEKKELSARPGGMQIQECAELNPVQPV